MRKIAAVLIALIASTAFAVAPQATKTINITAQCDGKSDWRFSVPGSNDATFTVDQGDLVTVTVSVPAGDCSAAGHGFLMEEYVADGFLIPRGQSKTVTFTATTAGEFHFICIQSSCGLGHSSMTGTMIVNAKATLAISSVAPNSGPTSGGTQVTISGSAFQSGATVAFGGIPAANVSVVDSSTITATTPLGPANEQLGVDVVVTNPDGTAVTLHPGFNYTVPAPQITTISPDVVLPGGGTVVTIIGAGFTTALNSSVTFGGTPATNVRILDAITLQVTAPAHAEGAVDVTINVGGSSVTKSGGVTYKTPALRRRSARH